MLNKLHRLNRYKGNSGKKFLKNDWCILTLKLGSLSLAIEQDTTLWQIFFSNIYLFDSIFSIIVWTNRLHDFDEWICFPDNCCYENG